MIAWKFTYVFMISNIGSWEVFHLLTHYSKMIQGPGCLTAGWRYPGFKIKPQRFSLSIYARLFTSKLPGGKLFLIHTGFLKKYFLIRWKISLNFKLRKTWLTIPAFEQPCRQDLLYYLVSLVKRWMSLANISNLETNLPKNFPNAGLWSCGNES